MKNLKSLVFVAILAVATSAMATHSDVSSKLRALYAKMDSLSMKKDVPGLSAFLKKTSTDDCTFISKPGKSGVPERKSRDQAMQTLARVMPVIDKVSTCASHIDSIHVSGSSAVATVTSRIVMITKAGSGGPAHKIAQKSKSEDTWVLVGGSWKLKVSKILTETVSQDGKEIPSR